MIAFRRRFAEPPSCAYRPGTVIDHRLVFMGLGGRRLPRLPGHFLFTDRWYNHFHCHYETEPAWSMYLVFTYAPNRCCRLIRFVAVYPAQ